MSNTLSFAKVGKVKAIVVKVEGHEITCRLCGWGERTADMEAEATEKLVLHLYDEHSLTY